jgi:hypothetical protein
MLKVHFAMIPNIGENGGFCYFSNVVWWMGDLHYNDLWWKHSFNILDDV